MPKTPFALIGLLLALSARAADCDPAPGRHTYANKCGICHVTEAGAAHTVGPNLHGVAGRAPGQAPGYAYSEALAGLGGAWDETRLDAFLKAPQQAVPGTAMPFQGLKSAAERRQLICFLQTLQ